MVSLNLTKIHGLAWMGFVSMLAKGASTKIDIQAIVLVMFLLWFATNLFA
jgi:hypothetical protein